MSTSQCALRTPRARGRPLPLAPGWPVNRERAAPQRPPAPVLPMHAARRAVRLTRRGRLLLSASCLALLVGLGWAGPREASVGGSAASAAAPATARLTVGAGHTLWQIARTLDPRTDPRITVERIRVLNGLPDSSIRAGQELVIPLT